MAVTINYIDGDLGGSSGSGTSGDPWSGMEYALLQYTQNGTDGNIFKCRGTDVVSAGLNAGGHDHNDPLWIDTWDGDYYLSGGGGNFELFPFSNGPKAIRLINSNFGTHNLKIGNTGTAPIGTFADYLGLEGVEITDTDGDAIVGRGQYSQISNCYFHNIGGNAIGSGSYCVEMISNCFFQNTGSRTMNNAVRAYLRARIINNVFDLDSTSNAIESYLSYGGIFRNNSIRVDSGSAFYTSNNNEINFAVENNLIEIGSSGTGIEASSTTSYKFAVRNNAVYGAGTKYDLSSPEIHCESDNESLSSVPFKETGASTWANHRAFFESVDQGNVRGGSYLTGYDKGAIQSAAGGGGGTTGMLRRSNQRGGF